MDFLKRIFTQRLRTDWEFTPGDLIWKLLPAADHMLVGESRNPDDKTMSLFAVDITTGTVNFSGVRLEEPWWIALEMILGDLAVLHRYPKPDLPSALGTTVIDIRSGTVLWQNDTLRILCGTDDVALAMRGTALDAREFLFVDARTGDIIEECGSDLSRAQEFQNICAERPVVSNWISSETLSTEEHPWLVSILGRELSEQWGETRIAQSGEFTVIGAHDRSRRSADAMLQGRVDSLLLILHGERVLYSERLALDAPAPADDLFFIWHNRVVFIRDQRTLAAIQLEV